MPRCARTSGSREREALAGGWWGNGGQGEEGRNCLGVSRKDRAHSSAAAALARDSGQEISSRMGGGGRHWQEGQGLPRPLHRPW